ncbi:unnamed protein product [Allacma fusca]|uniref:C2H2-type domain-containing protein n=1 Tax=Allacma fusca TaxID=39272 RepID=A0A8J2P7T3_9HEXA|nr:unnamed protein product [Allacma fusca]
MANFDRGLLLYVMNLIVLGVVCILYCLFTFCVFCARDSVRPYDLSAFEGGNPESVRGSPLEDSDDTLSHVYVSPTRKKRPLTIHPLRTNSFSRRSTAAFTRIKPKGQEEQAGAYVSIESSSTPRTHCKLWSYNCVDWDWNWIKGRGKKQNVLERIGVSITQNNSMCSIIVNQLIWFRKKEVLVSKEKFNEHVPQCNLVFENLMEDTGSSRSFLSVRKQNSRPKNTDRDGASKNIPRSSAASTFSRFISNPPNVSVSVQEDVSQEDSNSTESLDSSGTTSEPKSSNGDQKSSQTSSGHPGLRSSKNKESFECKASFSNLQGLKTHLRSHGDDRLYTCPCCKLVFASRRDDFVNHLQLHFSKGTSETQNILLLETNKTEGSKVAVVELVTE